MIRTSAIYRRFYAFGLVLFSAIASYSQAQAFVSPTREQLLNGLPVLFWQRPGDAKVLIKLRLNSGAAFDLAGKAGTMAMLSDALFPDPATREYVTEELGGRLEISIDYDSIDVTISGRASDLERIVELLRNAILNVNLSAESVTKLREARMAEIGKAPPTISQIADRAIAARLFGTFPYGRPIPGDPESLQKIERGDLMLAQERFLHSDNATLVVIGGVEKPRLMRALRQMLGPWQKADRVVPATFRQPNAPDDRVLLINQPGNKTAEIRVAVRGLARRDRDSNAAGLLALIAGERWQQAVTELSSVSVRHETHNLPGMLVFAASVPTASAQKAVTSAQDIMKGLGQNGASPAELERARNLALAEIGKRTGEPDSAADAWLNSEIDKTSPANPASDITRVTVADLQRVANKLFSGAPQAKIAAGDVDQLKSVFSTNFEIRSDKPEVKSSKDSSIPAKKP